MEIAPCATGIKEHNRRRVLAAFDGAVALTRSEIRQRTGLSRTTVAGIVTALLDEGTLHVPTHIPGLRESTGRPPTLLARSVPSGFGIGMDMGHERVQIAVCDFSGRVLVRGARPVGVRATAHEAARTAASLLADLLPRADVVGQHCHGAVAAIPEPIDLGGVVSRTSVASRWHLQRPAELLSDVVGIPVHAENDANLAIVGETTFGVGRTVEHALYVKISHGVGLGIIINGTLVRGAAGLAGEIGHNVARPDGIVCLCGNRGCLYTLAASQYLTSSLHAVTHNPDLTLDDLAAMGRQGHPGAGRVLRDAGREVGRVLANLCNTLNPRLVVIGGSLARAGGWAVTGLRETMADLTEAQVGSSLDIVASKLGERAEIYGALAMAIGLVDPQTGARAPRQSSDRA